MNEWLPERLPEDIEAERALLATCCAAGAELAATEIVFNLTEEDFVHPAHRVVFKALRALIEAQLDSFNAAWERSQSLHRTSTERVD